MANKKTKPTNTVYRVNVPAAMEAYDMTIGTWVSDIQPYLYADEELIQRIFKTWDNDRINSYLKRLITGNCASSVFLIADIESIHSILNDELLDTIDKDAKIALTENTKYFKTLLDDGKKYLLIDGKHRDDVIERVFRPSNVNEVIKFPAQGFGSLFVDDRDNIISIAGKSFSELNTDLKHYILSQKINVVMIREGNIESLQEAFVTTNLGIQLFPMELRICAMTDTARFIRSTTSPTTNYEIYRFFDRFGGFEGNKDKSKEKKGDLLLVSMVASYMSNVLSNSKNPYKDYFSSTALDNLFKSISSLSEEQKKTITTAIYKLAYGSLVEYKVTLQNDIKIKMSWVDFLNYACFYLHLITGKTPALNARGKFVSINDGRENEFIHHIITMVHKLREADKYILDKKGNKVPSLRYDAIKAEQVPILDKKGKPKFVENEHGFIRKDRNANSTNFNSKMEIMSIEFDNNYLDELEKLGIITLLDSMRVMNNFQKRSQSINQNMFDALTGKRMTFGDVDTKRTAKTHTKKYSKGNSEQVVGNFKSNLTSKSGEVF
jgi:hypothetical protein